MRQPLHKRGILEAVVAVMEVAVNWHGARVLNVLHRNGTEGHNVHLPVIGRRHGCNKRNELRMVVGGVVLDGSMNSDGLETEQLPEAIRDLYPGVALCVAWAATDLDGRGDLNAIQAIAGRNGRGVEEFTGRAYLISRGNQCNAEGCRIHAGCLGFLGS